MKSKRSFYWFILSIILLIISIRVIFFNPREIIFENAIIYGKVKSIKEVSYKAELINHELVKVKRWRIGHLTNDFDCFFDRKGNIIKRSTYPAQDTGSTYYTEWYKYGKNGLLIETFSPSTKWRRETFTYNNQNQLIKQERNLDYYLYEYDAKGKLSYKTQVTSDNRQEFKTKFIYEHNFVKYEDIHNISAGWHLVHEYKRDNSGNIIKYRLASTFQELKKEKWDEFDYKFDRYGNWIKCIHYRFKNPIYILEREIEYY